MTPESTIRSRAKMAGYTVYKSRERSEHVNNYGKYMLVDDHRNLVVLGDRYDATLEQIDEFILDSASPPALP